MSFFKMAEYRNEFLFLAASILATQFSSILSRCSKQHALHYPAENVCGKEMNEGMDAEYFVTSSVSSSLEENKYNCRIRLARPNTKFLCFQLYSSPGSLSTEETWGQYDLNIDVEAGKCNCINIKQYESFYMTVSGTSLKDETLFSFVLTNNTQSVTKLQVTTTKISLITTTPGIDEDDNSLAKYYFLMLIILAAVLLIFVLQVTKCRSSCKKLFEVRERSVAQLQVTRDIEPTDYQWVPSIAVSISEDYHARRRGSRELPSYNESQISQEAMASGIFYNINRNREDNELVLTLPPPYPGPPNKDPPPPYFECVS